MTRPIPVTLIRQGNGTWEEFSWYWPQTESPRNKYLFAQPSGQLGAPSGLTVATVGTPGTTRYAYAVSALDSQGKESGLSIPVLVTTGNALLSGTNYNQLTWAPLSGASAYRVYGGTASPQSVNALGLMTTVVAAQFSDQGVYSPNPAYVPPQVYAVTGIPGDATGTGTAGGQFSVMNSNQSLWDTPQRLYIGGHNYVIDDALRNELLAAVTQQAPNGYGAYIQAAPPGAVYTGDETILSGYDEVHPHASPV